MFLANKSKYSLLLSFVLIYCVYEATMNFCLIFGLALTTFYVILGSVIGDSLADRIYARVTKWYFFAISKAVNSLHF